MDNEKINWHQKSVQDIEEILNVNIDMRSKYRRGRKKTAYIWIK